MSSPYRMHTSALYNSGAMSSPSRPAPMMPPATNGSGSSQQFQQIQDMAAINSKLRTMDDRIDSVERTVAKVLSKVDQHNERMEADSRAVELMRISLREMESNLSLAQTTSQSICDRAVSDVTTMSSRLDEQENCMRNTHTDIRGLKRALEALESACGALQSQRGALQAELSQEVQNAENQLSSLIRTEVAECNKKISQSVRVVQQHVKTTVTGLNDTVSQRLVQVSKDHTEVVDLVRAQQSEANTTQDKLSDIRNEVESITTAQRRTDLSHSHLEEDMKTLNRRLMSALRHLSSSSTASLAVAGGASITQQVNSYLGGSQTKAQHGTGGVHSFSPNPSRDRSIHDGLCEGEGSTPDIDQFLTELDGMTRSQLGMV